jgi:hypothetical protein
MKQTRRRGMNKKTTTLRKRRERRQRGGGMFDYFKTEETKDNVPIQEQQGILDKLSSFFSKKDEQAPVPGPAQNMGGKKSRRRRN